MKLNTQTIPTGIQTALPIPRQVDNCGEKSSTLDTLPQIISALLNEALTGVIWCVEDKII
jgi:hypothetical protein